MVVAVRGGCGVGRAGGWVGVWGGWQSNLNRQFLFRAADIQKLKATTAAEAAARMNPALNIKCYRSPAPACACAGPRPQALLRRFDGLRGL